MSRNYYPTSTDTKVYILTGDYTSVNVSEIFDIAKEHFGDDVDLAKLNIYAEHIHTRAIGYDLCDPMDYDDYIIIEKIG